MSENVCDPQHVLTADTYSLAGIPQSSQWLGYRQCNRGIVLRFQVRKRYIFHFQRVQTASGAHPVSYSQVGSNRRGLKLTILIYKFPSSGISGALLNPRDLITCTVIIFTLFCLFRILNTLGSTPETGYLV